MVIEFFQLWSRWWLRKPNQLRREMFIDLESSNVIIQTEKGREHKFSDNDSEFDFLITQLLWLMGRLGCHKLVNQRQFFWCYYSNWPSLFGTCICSSFRFCSWPTPMTKVPMATETLNIANNIAKTPPKLWLHKNSGSIWTVRSSVYSHPLLMSY